MTKFAVTEAEVACEEGRIVERMQKGDDFFVLHPLSANVNTQLMNYRICGFFLSRCRACFTSS